MTFANSWGWLIIGVISPLVGAIPTAAWVVRLWTGKSLRQLGTGNVGVSATFYHAGRVAGLTVVILEALKGIGVVLLVRLAFENPAPWELIALATLVLGRYGFSRGAGTTNVVWGYVVHDWQISVLTALIGGTSFLLLRQRQWGKYGVLLILPSLMLFLNPHSYGRIAAAIALSCTIAWVYHQLPDDLDLAASEARPDAQGAFRLVRGDRRMKSLDKPLNPHQVGAKAATLARLKQAGYPVPPGVVLLAGDDPAIVATVLQPTGATPVIVRSSAVGEDDLAASAAGQYLSIPNVHDPDGLITAINRCLQSYHTAAAVQYRRDRQLPDQAMAVLVQAQIDGQFSGVAFSRDPVLRQGEAVVVEALPGGAARVVSGRETPDLYRVNLSIEEFHQIRTAHPEVDAPGRLPEAATLVVEGSGTVPARLIQQVAWMTRCLEADHYGVPQDVEWTYDGQQLWILQSRPVTTLQPIWTRKIAAEVIPGVIHPLTWSINRPLTCGVWGELFTIGLGDRAQGLNFNDTATLHYSRAYFNATLLGDIFRRMGLPGESLEFLTQGAAFQRPPVISTLRNLPGLWRLCQRELSLVEDFRQADAEQFAPSLAAWQAEPCESLPAMALKARLDEVLQQLRQVTYYNILGPLSAALRQAILRVKAADLDFSQSPEIASVRAIEAVAADYRSLIQRLLPDWDSSSTLFAAIAEHPDSQPILDRLDQVIQTYGYLSASATNLAVPRWQEHPYAVRELFAQLVTTPSSPSPRPTQRSTWRLQTVQTRVDLKGRIGEVYNQVLAELRRSLLAVGQRMVQHQELALADDVFFLDIDILRQFLDALAEVESGRSKALGLKLEALAIQRQQQWQQERELKSVPYLVYGNDPPPVTPPTRAIAQHLQGIGASPGQAMGTIHVVTSLEAAGQLPVDAILVVPYTDAGWAPLLARSRGIIAEVGGRLSHGAIVAREYGIPAVMNIPQATQRLQSGQRVYLDGTTGRVDLLSAD